MSYLSQFRVENRVLPKYRLWDTYAWHKAVWELFPGREDEERDFLFRIDSLRTHTRLLLLSPSTPCLPEWGEGKTKRVSGNFLGHDTYRFQVKANPTKRQFESRRRVGIHSDDELLAWFERKGNVCGFAVVPLHLKIGPPMANYFNRNGKKGKHISVDFSGVLRVTDRDNFLKAFYGGIGSAKAFGYGMLMLQPLRTA